MIAILYSSSFSVTISHVFNYTLEEVIAEVIKLLFGLSGVVDKNSTELILEKSEEG